MKISTFQQGQGNDDFFRAQKLATANNAVRFGKAGVTYRQAASRSVFEMAYPQAANTSRNRLNVLA